MRISVIIPVYNVEKYIVACFMSVVNQTWKDGIIECIFVDDLGEDHSVDIIESLISTYDGLIDFKIIHQTVNTGASGARNTGLKKANGDYVFFLDSDDEIMPDCFEKLAAPLKEYQYDFVFANHEVVCDWTNMNLNLTIPEGPIMTKMDIINTFHNGWFALAWNKLLRKDFLLDNNLFFEEGIVREDELWNFQLACVAQSMYVVNYRTYKYFIRSGSVMSDSKSMKHFESLTKVVEGQVSTVKKHGLENNQNLYNIIEEEKLECMEFAKRLLSFRECKSFYHKLRTLHYSCFCRFSKSSNKARLRDLQYLMPTDLSFLWVLFLNLIQEKLVAFRHRKT